MKKELLSVAKVLLTMQRMSWEQGIAAQAFFECGDPETGVLLVKEALHRTGQDGLLAIADPTYDSIDCGSNGLPAHYAYLHTKDETYKKAACRLADWYEFSAPRSSTGQLYHNPDTRRNMIDGIYHLVPGLIVAGHADFALLQIRLFHERHYDPASGLYRQLWDDDINAFSRRALWGGGQGWMAGALALACKFLPDNYRKERTQLSNMLENLIDTMQRYLRDDYMLHDVFDDPDTFPEITAPLMFCYAIYTGIQVSVIPESKKDLADKILSAAGKCVDSDGFVTNACSSPSFDRIGYSAEGQAFYMLCHAAKDLL